MEKFIKDRFKQSIADAAARLYDVAPDQLRSLGGFESFVYVMPGVHGERILRIMHESHRSSDEVMGELDWLAYLHASGAAVSRVCRNRYGEAVSTVGEFVICAFEKVPGRTIGEQDWNESLFARWGRALGRFHRLSKSFEPIHENFRRRNWNEDDLMDIHRYIPGDQTHVLRRGGALIDEIETLPMSKGNYGLIHCDAHPGNFFVEDGELTFFDFDDCLYHWYLYDIATVCFSGTLMPWVDMNDERHISRFMSGFWAGYRKENSTKEFDNRQFLLFLKLRELLQYTAINRSFDIDQLDDPFAIRFMHGRRERIENDVPYLGMDFLALAS